MGFSEALSLGAWSFDNLPQWVQAIVVSVSLFNDARDVWPPNVGLCHVAGGNITFPFSQCICEDSEGHLAPTCRTVHPNQHASFLLTIHLSRVKVEGASQWRSHDGPCAAPATTSHLGCSSRPSSCRGVPLPSTVAYIL